MKIAYNVITQLGRHHFSAVLLGSRTVARRSLRDRAGWLGLFLLLFGLTAQAQETAFRALSALESKIEVGVSLRDYSQALAEANYEVKLYAASPKAKPEVVQALNKAILRYTEAGQLWTMPRLGADTGSGKIILTRYPEAAKDLSQGGVLTTSVPIDGVRYSTIHTEFLLPYLWRDAAANVLRARQLAQ